MPTHRFNKISGIQLPGNMICGIKWKATISEAVAMTLSKKLNITVHRSFRTNKENEIAGKENSFQRTGKYKCFVVKIDKNGNDYFLTVRGSLHKYYHGNNAGSFYGFEILKAIKKMCDYFEINESETDIFNLEIGLNILVWFDVYVYLKNNLIQHKKERFNNMPDSKRFGFVAEHEDYLIKLYRKLNQMLRYEMKLVTKDLINNAGIYTLADVNEITINQLADGLVQQWREVITRDGLNLYDKNNRMDELTEKEREKILEFTSHVFVQSYNDKLKTASSQKQRDQLRQEAYRLKKCCRGIIKKHGNGDHGKLLGLIQELVLKFKESWSEDTREVSRFPIMVKQGNRDKFTRDTKKGNQIAYKINNMNTTDSKKSSKQIAIAKRKERELKINSFMESLKATLERIEFKQVPVKYKEAA